MTTPASPTKPAFVLPPKRKKPTLAQRWRHRRKPKDVRAQFLHSLKKKDLDEKRKLQEELVRLMQQINTLLVKEQKVMPAYGRKYKDEDPRSVFYYNMLRRVGLPEVHARFAPRFLKSQQIQLNRWSSVMFARLEQAFFALPEQITTLEMRMRQHQEEYDLIMKQGAAEGFDETTKPMEPRQQNQLMLQRAFRECSFFEEDTRKRRVGPKKSVPIIKDRDIDATQEEIDRLEIIPEVPQQNAPPGLAPQVRGQLESHGKHAYFTYNGRWKDGEMHGPMGVYTFADGGKYRGAWKNSQPHGAGVVIYPNGVKYTGSFENGKFHGYGVMEMVRGYRYEGEFRLGMRCGQGKLHFAASNTFYEGEFYQNKRHGKGTETNALGYSYTGYWKENRMCGPGRLIQPDKTEVFKQEWPLCILGDAIRLVKREKLEAEEKQETWYRQLLRVRDDLRVQDLQYAWWDKEAERMEREEEERIAGLKQARRDKREAEAAAKKAFLEQKMKDQEEVEGSDEDQVSDEKEEDDEDEEDDDDEEEEEEEEEDNDDDGEKKNDGDQPETTQ